MNSDTPRLQPSSPRPCRGPRWRVAAASLLVAAIAASCGSSSSTIASADTTATPAAAANETGDSNASGGSTSDELVDACALLSDVDVEAVLGMPVAEGTPTSEFGMSMCDVRAAEDPEFGQFALTVDPKNGPDNFERQKEMAAQVEEIDGLGDGAFRSGSKLFIVDGEALVWINAIADAEAGGPITTDALSEAARQILAQLDAR